MWLSSMHRDPGSLQSEEGNSDAQKEEERQIFTSDYEVFLSSLPYPAQVSTPRPWGSGDSKGQGLSFGLLPILLPSL